MLQILADVSGRRGEKDLQAQMKQNHALPCNMRLHRQPLIAKTAAKTAPRTPQAPKTAWHANSACAVAPRPCTDTHCVREGERQQTTRRTTHHVRKKSRGNTRQVLSWRSGSCPRAMRWICSSCLHPTRAADQLISRRDSALAPLQQPPPARLTRRLRRRFPLTCTWQEPSAPAAPGVRQ